MVLSIDWLQLHCSGVATFPADWQVERALYSTRQFKHIDTIYFSGLPFCELVHTPLSSILDDNMMLLKVNNARLYEPCMFDTLNHVIKTLKLNVKGVSRLDIACDLNKFHNNLAPENLIKKFFTQSYRKLGQTKFKAQGDQKRTVNFDYLRFGTNNSDVSVYLYNKSKEMREVKHKHYIYDKWSANGLLNDGDVWRLEFSIKGDRIKLYDESTAEIIGLSLGNLQSENLVQNMYLALVSKYFSFCHNTGNKNVSREKKIVLFKTISSTYKRYIYREMSDGTRADKIFIRKLEAVNCQLREIKEDLAVSGEEVLLQFISSKGMHQYYLDKVNGTLDSHVKHLRNKELTFEQNRDKIDSTLRENREDTEKQHNDFYNKHLTLN